MDRIRIAGICFEHFHMGDLLAMAARHPQVDLVAVCDDDRSRMNDAIVAHRMRDDQIFTDAAACIEAARPDVVIACPAAARHGDWAEKLLAYGVHVLMEKPMAASLEEADRMIAAAERSGKRLAINWPMVWYATHQSAFRRIGDGEIGEVVEVHYYDGNRGPLWHSAGKVQHTAAWVDAEKPRSWFYKRASGGGSLLDYMGYGATLASWFNGGQVPIEVTATVDQRHGLEVDEHAIAVLRYANGLSKLETRWGTFTDPWTHNPLPRCGFVIVGREGTIGVFDYAKELQMQTRSRPEVHAVPLDPLVYPHRDPIESFLHAIEKGTSFIGPLTLSLSRLGQQIIDAAVRSAATKQTVPLLPSAPRF
jgi:predicted dehydrogenase